jgi:phospholipid-binding lipoprotein MlaA
MNRRRTTVIAIPWVLSFVFTLSLGCARSPGVPNPNGAFDSPADFFSRANDAEDAPDYDPWRPFNKVVFTFNHDVLDEWLIRPTATGWQKVMPEPARRAIGRAFDNVDMPRRFVNNLLQVRPIGAARELGRFLVNTTVGVVGLFDVAALIDIEPSDADFGQTLAMYGVGAGPYLVLPAKSPSTVRDAIGGVADGFLDPLGLFLPFVADQARAVLNAINDRSLKLEMFADVEESVLDLYTAARNGYLQRRRFVIREAIADRDDEWRTELGWIADEPEQPMAASIPTSENPS